MLSKLYELIDGIRYVIPYSHEFKTYAKGRWIGKELFNVMSSEFGGQSKEYWESAIREGKVKINNTKIEKSYVFRDSDYLTHVTHRHEPPVIGNVEYVGDTMDILAVSKPASMPCHPCGSYRLNSLLQILYNEPIIPNQSKLFLVHRLDRVTSGLVIIAKSTEVASRISKEIREKTTTKVYLARVKGRFPGRLTHLHSLSQEQLNAAIVEAATEGEGLDKEDFNNNDNKDDNDHNTTHKTDGEITSSNNNSSAEALRRNKEKQKQQQQLKRKQGHNNNVNVNDANPNVSNKRLKRQMQAAHKAQMNAAKTTAAMSTMNANNDKTTANSTTAAAETVGILPMANASNNNSHNTNTIIPDSNIANSANVISTTSSSTARVLSNDDVEAKAAVYNHMQFNSLSPEEVGRGDRVGYFIETTPSSSSLSSSSSLVIDNESSIAITAISSTASSPIASISPTNSALPITYTLVCPLATQSYREGIHACHPVLGKQSITKFRSLGYNEDDDTSLVECQLLTGRTHQIRLHLQLLDSPIANDPCYGGALFFGEPARHTEALTILRRMKQQGHQPLSKVPHLLLQELLDEEVKEEVKEKEKEKEVQECGVTTADNISSMRMNSDISSSNDTVSINHNICNECVTAVNDDDNHQPNTTETSLNTAANHGSKNICRFCDDKTSTVALERILHCDGIWLHCLRMSGGNWSFQAPLPAWASKGSFKHIE